MTYFKNPGLYIAHSLLTAGLLTTSPVFADEASEESIEHLTIFGDAQQVNDVPGSAHLINEQTLEKHNYTDIMRILTSVPGIYVLEEDGFGLRPNIGMRGTGQNRSEKITIMEDGVLAAPAPYSAPSAYYFPTAGRMQQIEILKGTSSAIYGPRTTGGVINLLSRQIPDNSREGMVDVSTGEHGFGKLHSFISSGDEFVGALFEVFRYQADGFKSLNNSDKNVGFVKHDILSKLRFNMGSRERTNLIEFKLKYSDEDADETYMGLTDEDFINAPYSRYSASELDNMSTTHKQIQINHEVQLSNAITLGSTVYYNHFERNWYKVSKIGGLSLNNGGIDAISAFEQDSDRSSISVDIKANNRAYVSTGLQSTLKIELENHELQLGARIHEDEMDRFQWVDKFELNSQLNLILNTPGIPGTDSNRIDSAKAFAAYIHDEFEVSNVIINAGLRYEDITLNREDWGKTNPSRSTLPALRENDLKILLPSIALTYKVNDATVLLAGFQKGFAPPSPGNANAENEESFNYEFGGRISSDTFDAEAILFYSDYANMHGNCTASQGCNIDNQGEQYNAGEVIVSGVELQGSYVLDYGHFRFPFNVNYTYTHSEFQNKFTSLLDTWGDVQKGDELPYVPTNQAQIDAGIETEDWQGYITVKYVGNVRTKAGTGTILQSNIINRRVIVDLSAQYELNSNQALSMNIENVFDKQYIATRVFGSAMAGKPRSVSLGYRYTF